MSARTDSRVVLDTYAILVLLNDEPGAATVEGVLLHGEPWMTLVNLGEATYITERERGKDHADEVFSNLLSPLRPDGGAPISWMPIDARLVREAASLKAVGGISYADAFSAAAARLLNCPVLTGDAEFAVVEKLGIAVQWL